MCNLRYGLQLQVKPHEEFCKSIFLSCAEKKLVVPVLELKRLQEAEAMVARFSRENEWLALQVNFLWSVIHADVILT